MLAAGAVYVAGRSKAATADFTPTDIDLPEPRTVTRPKPASGSIILDALKEEIFELELEHKQGRISDQEYQKAKAALDQTLERALKRQAAKQT